MKNTPYTVRMNEDRKITFPEEIIREAGMEGGDAIEVSYENGVRLKMLGRCSASGTSYSVPAINTLLERNFPHSSASFCTSGKVSGFHSRNAVL